ncbi:MAG: glycosyl hydrolase-related protein, partial [Chloroflexota bacterium]|nr:glycosyl hydrolase-related protein [Chloroflexota bacterium]
ADRPRPAPPVAPRRGPTGSPAPTLVTGRTLFHLGGDACVQLSALRAGPDDSVLIRLLNPGRGTAAATLRFGRPIATARTVDLREGESGLGNTGLEVIRTAAPLELVGDGAIATLAPYEIGSWLITLA